MNMNWTKSAVAVLAIAVMATGALAQDGGGGRGGRGMRMMRMGGDNSMMLLMRKDVLADLQLNAEQTKALDELRKKNEEEMSAMRENMRAGGGDFEAMRSEMEKRQKENKVKVDAILSEGQRVRLKEISIQVRGNSALMDPEIQKSLELKSSQKDAIDALQAKAQEAMMAVFEKRRNGELDQDQMGDIMRKNRDIMNVELGKILEPAQTEKFKAMQGKPFKATEPERGFGGRGGGGRGGR